MNKNIDYNFSDVYEEYYNSSNKTVHQIKGEKTKIQDTIKRIEEKYFPNRNIFRNHDKNSDYLFRFEIKELLMLLIKLESMNVFNDRKALKDGISDKNIEKLLNYVEIAENWNLTDYQYRLIFKKYDVEEISNTINSIKKFQDSLTNFFVTVVNSYASFTSDYFVYISRQFDKWTNNIIVNDTFIPKNQPSVKYYKDHAQESYTYKFLDLKYAVIGAIYELSDFLYKFDDEGKCVRKPFDSSFKNIDEELMKKSKKLFEEYVYQESNDYYENADDIDESINNCHKEVEELLNKYYLHIIPNDVNEVEQNCDNNKENKVKEFKKYFRKFCSGYLEALYIIRSKLTNKNLKIYPEEEYEKYLNKYNSFRRYLYSYNKEIQVDGFENTLWQYMKKIKVKNMKDITHNIKIIISCEQYMNGVIQWFDLGSLVDNDEISDFYKPLYEETIIKNSEKINDDVGDIIKNMIAMIIKRDYENLKKLQKVNSEILEFL